MNCLVTGAAGFVGGRLAERLLNSGHTVSLLLPPVVDAEPWRRRGAQVIQGVPEGLEDDFGAQLAHTEVVFHCDFWLDIRGNRELFRQTNVLGTRRLLDAIFDAPVRRVVYLSSQVVAWDGHGLLDPEGPFQYPAEHGDPYSAARADAERMILGAARAGRVEAVALRPGWTWGPGDTIILPLLVRYGLEGPLPLVARGEHLISITYVENLVDALLAAAVAPGVNGRALLVSDGAPLAWRSFIDRQLAALGVIASFRNIPALVAGAAAAVVEALAPLVGAPLPLIRLVSGMASVDLVHNLAPASQTLGFEPRVTLDEGLDHLHAWAHQLGGAAAVAALHQPLEEDPAP